MSSELDSCLPVIAHDSWNEEGIFYIHSYCTFALIIWLCSSLKMYFVPLQRPW